METDSLPKTIIVQPSSREELSRALAQANLKGSKIAEVDLSLLRRVLQYTPEDMTVTTEAGIALAELQGHLRTHGQWLPIDPPNAGGLTIGRLLDTNASGPHRYGCGTIRDHLIGLRVALADGTVVRSGGQVVKNVAGYDLLKLFVGAFGSLGIIVEATFKLLPLPEAEASIGAECQSLSQAEALIGAVFDSDLSPVVFDLHNVFGTAGETVDRVQIVLGFAGTQEDVNWQMSKASVLGFKESTSLDYEPRFWNEAATRKSYCFSELPSRLTGAIRDLGASRFVARAGNGSVFYLGGNPPPKPDLPIPLIRRVKDVFDPNHLFPDLPT
jgi:FAD/FMN-containing dehydrogenase